MPGLHVNIFETSRGLVTGKQEIRDDADLNRLFQWQESALNAWDNAKQRGIVEAMTGTGKTILAIKSLKRLQSRGERVSPLIVVPTIALLNQWCEQLRKDFPDCPIGRIGDGSRGSFAVGDGGALPVVCVSTIHSAVPAVENGLFAHCQFGGHKSFLIADECQRYLNEDQKLFNRILRHPYDYTLGLSATIDQFEVEGLGKIVFKFSINDAVAGGIIPRFDVLNVGVTLTSDELTQYLELGTRLQQLQKSLLIMYPELKYLEGDFYWAFLKRLLNDEEDPTVRAIFGCLFKRAALSHTSAVKLRLMPQIIELLVSKAQKKMLVFFERIWTAEAGQDDVVQRVAVQVRDSVTGIGSSRNDDPVWCKLFHSEMKNGHRDAILQEFRGIGPSALLTCRALDEGLDVPAVDAAMLVASTQSPRQRLQRIGRTLRRGDGHKRPLIVILYVNGTSDSNIRISADDPEFKDAATIYDADAKNCLQKITEILGMAEPSGRPANSPACTTMPRPKPQIVPQDRQWDLVVNARVTRSALNTALSRIARKTVLKLELMDGIVLTGEWRMLLEEVLFLEKPVRQIAARRVAQLWTECLKQK